MPEDKSLDEVRVLGEARTKGLGLPAAVVAAHRAGHTYRAIAAECGLSFQRVAQIVSEAKEEK